MRKNIVKKPREEELNDNYMELANAIVLQACCDYQSIKGNSPKDVVRKESIKDFFHSELYGLITDIDPDDLIKRLDKGYSVQR